MGDGGEAEKRNRRQDLLTAFHTLPPPPSPWGPAIYNTGLSPPPSKLALKKIKTFF